MIKLAVDAMGGDLGSKIVVDAVLNYLNEHNDVEFYVVGKKEELTALEGKANIVDARDVMGMEDGALSILRKKETSMNKAVELVSSSQCDGVVSCGSTGAFLTLATLKVKLIPGVKRAALGTFMPTLVEGKYTLILDVGASNENNAEQIAQFAEIGECVYRNVYKKDAVNVYLLSNGAEEHKGCPEGKEAYQILKNHQYPWFKGNMEAKECLNGSVDVLATGGYAGNVLLKSIEGTAMMVSSLLKESLYMNLRTKIGAKIAYPALKNLKKRIDPSKGGGACLMGINKVCVKAHGNANARAFQTAIEYAINMINSPMIDSLKEKYGTKD
ncbi:MAG: phosphate acyltransferase PlsX [Erysipelotrichaceae bacterium]|nr:phosphate acyltransferase PlsX [Erysipelotrichaceae bacterium]